MSDVRPDRDDDEAVTPADPMQTEEVLADDQWSEAGSSNDEAAGTDDEGAAAADAAADAAAQVDIDFDLARHAIERERDEYLDALRRLQADFENYKKRMVRQQTELLDRAGEVLVDKLLPVLDAIDLARQHGAGEGVEQIATALTDALVREGLERIDPVGEKFDPNEHEAVAHHPAEDGDDGEVVSALMRAGYRWKGKLLRPAMVAVRG